MVGQKFSPSSMDASYLRKVRKPMVEKKRRDRMNASISQLKTLLGHSLKNEQSTLKLDKADILDLTVGYLTKLRHQQDSITMATHATSYKTGFQECASETMRYLSSNKTMTTDSMYRLNSHLHNVCMNSSQQRHSSSDVGATPPSQLQERYLSSPLDITFDTPARAQCYSDSGSLCSPNSSMGSVDYDVYSGNEVMLGNIIQEEKPWRPW